MIVYFLRFLKLLGIATAMRRLGMAGLVAQTNRHLLAQERYRTARAYLHGKGLEIGALHFPLPLPSGVTVRYVDNKTQEENLKRCPNAKRSQVLLPDLVEDGFILASLPKASEDFVIANHVLEHAPDPLGALHNWARIIRNGGCIFLTLPIAEQCFDRKRPISSLEHLKEDYHLSAAGDLHSRRQLDRTHYLEWATLSEPEAALAQDGPTLLSQNEQIIRAEQLWTDSADIHFHTFTPVSFAAMLDYFVTEIDRNFSVAEIRLCKNEIIAVLKHMG